MASTTPLSESKPVVKTSEIKDPICFLFIITGSLRNWIFTEQKLTKKNFSFNKLFNTIVKKTVLNTIFKLSTSIFTNSILAINLKKNLNQFNIKNVLRLKLNLCLICLKFFNRVYYKDQLKNLICLEYNNNIKILKYTLLKSVKSFYYKFSK